MHAEIGNVREPMAPVATTRDLQRLTMSNAARIPTNLQTILRPIRGLGTLVGE